MHTNFTPLFLLGESVFNIDMVQIGTIRRPKPVVLRLISANGETIRNVEVPSTFKVSDLQMFKTTGVAKLEVVA